MRRSRRRCTLALAAVAVETLLVAALAAAVWWQRALIAGQQRQTDELHEMLERRITDELNGEI